MSNFKIGDKVKIIASSWQDGRPHEFTQWVIGKTGTIIDTNKFDYDWRVKIDDPGPGNASEMPFIKSDLERITDMESKFRVGDRVVDGEGEHEREIVEVKVTYTAKDIWDGTDVEMGWDEDEVKDWTLASDKTEITLEEIAAKFNIPVSKLRIKE